MPKINLPPKKTRKPKPRNNTAKRQLRQQAYSSAKWRKVRLTYLVDHPMCEICEKSPAMDIHHMQSFIVDGEIDWGLLLDSDNLKALCKDCHAEIHNRQQGLKTVSSTIERLNKLLEGK